MAYNASENEKKVLEFWDKDKTFEKSVEERPADKPYVFYDGPPFATGLPHYGHIVASVMKDVVPRYWTMQGYRVERVWGWDCHGLPIENIIEKELGTKSKKDIEDMGVAKFNEMCRSKVLGYVAEWEKTIHRLGRWVDMKNAYKTMDKQYMESVWWVFKQLWEKDYLYKGYKPMHICPRCETTLSQQEVSEGYKMVKDMSVTAQFKVTSPETAQKLDVEGDLYLLAWTTTPWTLPGNVLIAVGEELEYAIVKFESAHFVVAKDLVMKNFDGKEFQVVSNVTGADLVGTTYEPLFPYFADSENSFRIVAADFVTTEDGTGLVHLAPAFGTDDYEVFKQENVPFIQHVKMNGYFIDEVTDLAGLHVKPMDDPMATDIEIVKWLAHNGKLFSKKKYEHSYPHCWRCDAPLLNYATDSWYLNVLKVKEKALEYAKQVNWSPAHIKEGRFGKWLEGARDWSISRQRFWASCIPIWQSEDGDMICVGSAAELEELSGQKVDDLHKHILDEITFEKDGKVYKRVPDVLDTWFDSGSMPYAQMHYPFENETKFDAGFPAQFIAEGQDQTRAWFYYLHVIASAIKEKPAYQNVIVNGIVLAEDGKKMSKKLKNYPDPNEVLEKYGADALRYYLLSSPVMQAENLSFSEDGVREVFNKVINTLENVYAFYLMFAEHGRQSTVDSQQSTNVLDKWILTRLNQLVGDVTEAMNSYNLPDASRPIMEFISDLSQWYVRRSRDRFKGNDKEDKAFALATVKDVLETLSLVMAPFTPFMAERVYHGVTGSAQSVHLQKWPTAGQVDSDMLREMEQTRKLVEMGMSLRKEHKQKVRQPLQLFSILNSDLSDQYLGIIAAELNVKEVRSEASMPEEFMTKQDGGVTVGLDVTLNQALEKEGLVREIVRAVSQLRKEQGLTREDRIRITYHTEDVMLQSIFSEFADELKSTTLADTLEAGEGDTALSLNNHTVQLTVSKV